MAAVLVVMKKYLALCGVFFLAAAVQALPMAAGAAVIFSMDYEQPANAAHIMATMPTQPIADALTVDCSVARSGRCSVRARVEAAASSISAGAYRAESDTMALLPTCYSPGDTVRYRFSLRLPADWQLQPRSAIDLVWQFKRFDGPPDIFVAVKGNSLVLRAGAKAQVTLLEPVPLGQWMDVDMTVHWSALPDGWVNGQVAVDNANAALPFDYAGPTTRNDKPGAAYLKWGLYKPGKTDGSMQFAPRTVWHDDIRIERVQ